MNYKQHRLNVLKEWLDQDARYSPQERIEAEAAFAKMTVTQLKAVSTLVTSAFTKGYRKASRDREESDERELNWNTQMQGVYK